MNAFDVLNERGYIEQYTHEEEIKERLKNGKITFYIGFDPTADSLHVGHYIQIMVMSHMQKFGHVPIALIGGGTTMVGDPSGRTDMRKMLSAETIAQNADNFKNVFERFIDFSDNKAIMANNADWLMDLNYIEFLRDVGAHFSVNKMLAAECYKNRMEKGLSFLEFNYMIMQSFDFYKLNELYGCEMQFGGNDQWSNIIGGVELIRKKTGKSAYGMTFKLLENSEGKKMGKTEKGALWLDPNKTSPYEFYQYWRNINDEDVKKCMSLLTFMPMEEINEYASLKDEKINSAKEKLAYEVTKLVHGEEDARNAQSAAKSLFTGSGEDENTPFTQIDISEVEEGIDVLNILIKTSLAPSKSEARRLVEQGGIIINGTKIEDIATVFIQYDFEQGYLLIKKGKKTFHKLVMKI